MTMKQPFEQAVRRHGAAVLRVCRGVLGPGPDADDAWSETFLAALGAWPTLPDDANVEAWLVRVATRKAIDVTRARARNPVPAAVLPERATGVGLPAAEALDLWRAVAALPERQRLTVACHYLGGLTHAETAELIGGSADACRRAAADGIRRLRLTYPDVNHQGGDQR